MIAVIQRVSQASVTVGDEIVGEIGPGLVALVAVTKDDTEADAKWLARKLTELRIFRNADKHFDLDVRAAIHPGELVRLQLGGSPERRHVVGRLQHGVGGDRAAERMLDRPNPGGRRCERRGEVGRLVDHDLGSMRLDDGSQRTHPTRRLDQCEPSRERRGATPLGRQRGYPLPMSIDLRPELVDRRAGLLEPKAGTFDPLSMVRRPGDRDVVSTSCERLRERHERNQVAVACGRCEQDAHQPRDDRC